MQKLNVLDWLAMLLVTLGALNWGAIGLLNLNLVQIALGSLHDGPRIAYIVVGVAGFYMAIVAFKLTSEN